MGTHGVVELPINLPVDLEKRPLLNQCSTCPHMQSRDYKYLVRWSLDVNGHTMGGDYIDEPHPCHDHPERLCIGHCADLKLRKDRIESPISVPQDTPRETKPDWKTLMDAWGNDGGTVDDYQE